MPLPPVAVTAGSSAASAVHHGGHVFDPGDVCVERGHDGAAAHGLEGVAAAARAEIEQPVPRAETEALIADGQHLIGVRPASTCWRSIAQR